MVVDFQGMLGLRVTFSGLVHVRQTSLPGYSACWKMVFGKQRKASKIDQKGLEQYPP